MSDTSQTELLAWLKGKYLSGGSLNIVIFFFFIFPPHTWHMKVPRLGSEIELQL